MQFACACALSLAVSLVNAWVQSPSERLRHALLYQVHQEGTADTMLWQERQHHQESGFLLAHQLTLARADSIATSDTHFHASPTVTL